MPAILGSLEQWTTAHSHLINGVDVLFSLFIGVALFWVAHKANGIAKATQLNTAQKLQEYERKIIKKHYQNLTKALQKVFEDGDVTTPTMQLFWDLERSAQLELPDDLNFYIKNLVKIANEAWRAHSYAYNNQGDAINIQKSDRSEKCEIATKKAQQLVDILVNGEASQKYSEYLKVQGSVQPILRK